MMMDWKTLVDKYDLVTKVTGVLHCGARLGEEAEDYEAIGVRNVWWVEGNDAVIPQLSAKVIPLGHHVIEAILSDQDGVPTTLHVTNVDGLSSSILDFGTHKQFSPDMVFERDHTALSDTVDSLVARHHIANVNFLSMDLQGAELMVLKGAQELLPQIDFVMTEVNNDEVYIGCARVEQLDDLLNDFERVETLWVGDQGWGDALFVRRRRSPRRWQYPVPAGSPQ